MLPNMNQPNLFNLKSLLQTTQNQNQENWIALAAIYAAMLQQQQQQMMAAAAFAQLNQQQPVDLPLLYSQMMTSDKLLQNSSPEIISLAESPSLKKRKSTIEVECESKRPCSSSSSLATPVISASHTPATTAAQFGITNETPAPVKPSSSSQSDNEADEFIDVVGDPVPKTKAQRKAHIEFYRKLKLLRNREKNLQCSLCSDSVNNIESDIRAHVTSHAEGSILICKLCCYSAGDLHQIFLHMSTLHPKHRDSYEDRRDMTQLSDLLTACFPRGLTKQKSGIQDLIQKVVENAKKTGSDALEVECQRCQKNVAATREYLTKHLNNQHQVYKCKKCKQVHDSEEQMVEHINSAHESTEAKIGSGYHVSGAAEAVIGIFKKCFEKYLN
uniref:C2H2-type domain-containing protein n=1 Tax=Panagrolaimus sp. JU765 TaxID=591449 RepID=A0AC34QVZ9_9BILA